MSKKLDWKFREAIPKVITDNLLDKVINGERPEETIKYNPITDAMTSDIEWRPNVVQDQL